jgi:gliding motility-associated-like protein
LDISSSGNNPVSYDLYLNNQLHTSFSNLSYGEDSVLISGLGLYQITNLKDAFCEGENSEEYNLILKERPLAEFSLYPRETSISEPIVYVNDQSLFANYYEWSFGDSSNVSFEMDTYHEYQEAGTFDITLYVENEFGCKDSAISKVIIYPEFELYIPNAFTPDGDDINDSFLCKGYGIDRYSISILNRWGQLVFSSNDINKAWDGKNAINGVYVYRIEIIDLIGKLHFFEGEISMLR